MVGKPGCDFSFSGLKTAVRRRVEEAGDGLTEQGIADIAAAFQKAVAASLVDRTRRAAELLEAEGLTGRPLVVAGGVAANGTIRAALAALAESRGMPFVAPPLALCGDNGAMIAWAGQERLALGLVDGMDFRPRPRWPLDPDAAPSIGAGRVKA